MCEKCQNVEDIASVTSIKGSTFTEFKIFDINVQNKKMDENKSTEINFHLKFKRKK